MKRQKEYHMNIGGASIILLLVVFALSVFAVLSVRASYHEMKLAEKTKESIESYYTADAAAEDYYQDLFLAVKEKTTGGVLPKLEDIIKLVEKPSNIECEQSDNKVIYQVPVNETTRLCVQLRLDKELVIESWRLSEYESTGYSDSELNLWDGEIPE